MYQKNSNRAKKLLTHYFRMIFERVGLQFDADNQAEVEELVDAIILETIEQVKPDLRDPFPVGYGMDDLPLDTEYRGRDLELVYEPAIEGA